MNIISLAYKFLQGKDEPNNFTEELNKYADYDEMRAAHPELNYCEESTMEIADFIKNYYYVKKNIF